MKRLTSILAILMCVFMLLGTATSAFAGPGKSKACENASDKGKSNANSKSALGNCDNTSDDNGSNDGNNDDGGSGDDTNNDTGGDPAPTDTSGGGECDPANPQNC